MERLTDRELAKALKSNCDGLKRAGIEPNMSDLRYIKLAEYENEEERTQNVDGKGVNDVIMRRFTERR